MSVVDIQTVELEPLTGKPTGKWFHRVGHVFQGYVLVQVYDRRGAGIPLPGAGGSIRQYPDGGYIEVPTLSESYYPLTVVMMGCSI